MRTETERYDIVRFSKVTQSLRPREEALRSQMNYVGAKLLVNFDPGQEYFLVLVWKQG